MTTTESIRVHDDDPLATAAERIPLGWSRFGKQTITEGPSPVSVRPLGLRFAVAPAGATADLPPWHYCPDRQIALGEDGEPWYRSLTDGTMGTTGQSSDGGPSTGGEEWTPDYLSDETD